MKGCKFITDLLVFGQSHYSDWVMTVQLECFVEIVRVFKVFKCSSVYKCMSFNNLNFSVI